jgi:hypothetical protein
MLPCVKRNRSSNTGTPSRATFGSTATADLCTSTADGPSTGNLTNGSTCPLASPLVSSRSASTKCSWKGAATLRDVPAGSSTYRGERRPPLRSRYARAAHTPRRAWLSSGRRMLPHWCTSCVRASGGPRETMRRASSHSDAMFNARPGASADAAPVPRRVGAAADNRPVARGARAVGAPAGRRSSAPSPTTSRHRPLRPARPLDGASCDMTTYTSADDTYSRLSGRRWI